MYILKNAFRNITRIKGRSILMFILILVISTSACTALVIKSSADSVEESLLESMTITASISTNREGLMGTAMGEGMTSSSDIDEDAMAEMMELMSSGVSLEELMTYSEADSVSSFYYSADIGLNAEEDGIEAYSTGTEDFVMQEGASMMGGMEAMGGLSSSTTSSSSDFQVTGYSSHDAMVGFIEGTMTIYDGEMFDIDDETNQCVISYELAYFNDLEVGDTFTLVNSLNEEDTVEFEISGIFYCESSDSYSNCVYISYTSMMAIIEASEDLDGTYISERTEEETSSTLSTSDNATFVFASVESYEAFPDEAEALGLDLETYTITSTDLTEFESSLEPLESTSQFVMVFLLVVLAIGAIILIVFNLFSIRERKYEIGVLAAIGMAKRKVAMQFISEVLIITFLAVIVGSGVGTLVSSPIADYLLESQIESVETSSEDISSNFGGNFSGTRQQSPAMSSGMGSTSITSMLGFETVDYVDSIEVSGSVVVLIELLVIGLLLALVSSSVAMISILRYEPLKILSDRT